MIHIDFEKFNKAGLKPILDKFEKAGLPVAGVDADNKAKARIRLSDKDGYHQFRYGKRVLHGERYWLAHDDQLGVRSACSLVHQKWAATGEY